MLTAIFLLRDFFYSPFMISLYNSSIGFLCTISLYRYPSITSTGKLLPHPSVPKEQTLQLYERSVHLRSNRHGQA